jgi:hypothetical protein
LTRPQNVPPVEGVESDRTRNEAIVKYTLACYTDRPGNCLVYQPNISKSGEYVLACPPTFGRVWIHIVANMVGLDRESTCNRSLHRRVKAKLTFPPFVNSQNN